MTATAVEADLPPSDLESLTVPAGPEHYALTDLEGEGEGEGNNNYEDSEISWGCAAEAEDGGQQAQGRHEGHEELFGELQPVTRREEAFEAVE